jgi:hypothetical protein
MSSPSCLKKPCWSANSMNELFQKPRCGTATLRVSAVRGAGPDCRNRGRDHAGEKNDRATHGVSPCRDFCVKASLDHVGKGAKVSVN